MSTLASAAADPWLTDQLGVPAFHLTGDAATLPTGPSFVDAKVPTDEVAVVTALEDAGFRVIDTAVTLELAGREVDATGIGTVVEHATAADADAVGRIAATALTLSRFHLDPHIPQSAAAALKASWATNFFAGARGDWLVVARDGEAAIGFLLLLDRPDALVIDLIAVDPACQSRGAGRAMVAFAAAACGTAPCIRVGTQAANVGSLRFYESLGFRVTRTEYVLHRHGR